MIRFKKKTQPDNRRSANYQPRPQVFSYHANRSPDSLGRERRITTQSTQPQENGRLIWQQLPGLIAIAAIVISIVYLFLLETAPRLEIAGDDTETALLRDNHVYQKATEEILKKSVFNRSKLTINTEKVANELIRAFPEIKSATITIPIASHNPVVKIEPAKPALILLASGAQPIIVDTQGRAVIESSQVPNLGDLKLTRIFDESGFGAEPAQNVISRQNIDFISAIIGHFKAAGQEIESLTLPVIPQELHVRLVGYDYFVKFDMTGEAKLQSGSLFAVMEMLQKSTNRPTEYIDVRVPGKAYYK